MKPGRDASGAAIALFTANLHNPKAVTHRTTLQGIIYQLDAALLSIETQKAGLVFIYDMSASKYSNFDYELSQRILNLLKVSFLFRTFFLFYINSFSIWKSLSTSHKIGDFRFVKFEFFYRYYSCQRYSFRFEKTYILNEIISFASSFFSDGMDL